jgi:high affinity Mn2+ porin
MFFHARFVRSPASLIPLLGTFWAHAAFAEDAAPSVQTPTELARSEESVSLHYQATVATQAHPSFYARYSGQNSMSAEAESATAMVMTLDADARLWPGAELIFNPELSGGRGLSRTLGVAAFPSGIVYRVGNPSPTIYLARLELRQTVGLGGGRSEVSQGPNQLAGRRDRNSLTISVGRLSVTDVFDGNAYAHDPTTQFFDWALFASGAWDYPADTRGYTWGVISDLSVNWWSLRTGIALLPKYGNLLPMEWRIDKARALMAEFEARYAIASQRGSARLLLFANDARMGSYAQAIDDPAFGLDVTATRAFGRHKYGFALNADQKLGETLGGFVRLSYNDGANETWAFTEIDRSFAMGLVQNGALWSRANDEAGAAFVVDGLSAVHRRYLERGGYGFLIGDGALRYGPEFVGDFYYRAELTREMALSGVYQPIVNPGYNRSRGPVHVFSARLHIAF